MQDKSIVAPHPCIICGNPILRREREKSCEHAVRKTCSPTCHKIYAPQRLHELRLARRYADAQPGVLPLANGMIAYVDPEDDERVRQHLWCSYTTSGITYAKTTDNSPPNRPQILLHRFIMHAPPEVRIDHWDGDGLNCRTSNLRESTSSQNQANARKAGNTSSRFKGVCWHTNEHRWYASIKVNGKNIHLGSFTIESDAAQAYDQAARHHFKAFACVNFPQEGERGALT